MEKAIQKVILYAQPDDSREDLADIERQLERAGIDYVLGKGVISESFTPVVRIDGELLSGPKQLFDYLAHTR